MTTTNTINITDVGPINQLAIQVNPEGGVTILRGVNGSGKSTALRATEALVRGDGKLQTRDGSRNGGRVDGLGALLVLGNKTTRAGEVEVHSLEGKLAISDLVTPPLKDPAAADRQRIKALVSLSGIEPTPEQFANVIGKDLAEYINAATWANKDLLDVAAKAKRDLEGAARLKENESSMREGQSKACAESAKGIDTKAPHDAEALSDAMVEASSKLSVLRDRAKSAEESAGRIAKARDLLNTARETYTGPSVDDAKLRLEAAETEKEEARGKVAELERQLRAAEAACDRKIDAVVAADKALAAAREHESTIQNYETILKETAATPPSTDELTKAEQALRDAHKAVEAGAVIRRALDELAKAEQHNRAATEAADVASRLRQAAAQIDDVLSKAIESDSLFVRDGRLYTSTPPRGETLFHELSEGERWEIAFDIAAPIVGEHGLLVLPQEAWQSLDPESKDHVADLARDRRVCVLTAEAADGELRAESFNGSN